MNRILFLGMDLSGKSHGSSNVAIFLGRNIRSNLLTSDRTIYNKAVTEMKTENLTDKEKLYLTQYINMIWITLNILQKSKTYHLFKTILVLSETFHIFIIGGMILKI